MLAAVRRDCVLVTLQARSDPIPILWHLSAEPPGVLQTWRLRRSRRLGPRQARCEDDDRKQDASNDRAGVHGTPQSWGRGARQIGWTLGAGNDHALGCGGEVVQLGV